MSVELGGAYFVALVGGVVIVHVTLPQISKIWEIRKTWEIRKIPLMHISWSMRMHKCQEF